MSSTMKIKKRTPAKPAHKRPRLLVRASNKSPSTGSDAKPTSKTSQTSLEVQVKAVIKSLKRLAEKRILEDMSNRYGNYTKKAFGV